MTMASTHVGVVVAMTLVALMAPRDIAASKTVVVDTPSGKVEGVDRGTSTCKLSSFCLANLCVCCPHRGHRITAKCSDDRTLPHALDEWCVLH
jgi:hypothetical protein